MREAGNFMGSEVRHLGVNATATCRFCGAVQLFDLERFEGSPGVRWDLIE